MDDRGGHAKWDAELTVHDPAIDRQHQGIIATIALLQTELARGARDEEVLELVDRLEAFLLVHFGTEEAHMEKLGFPGLEEHRTQHRRCLERLDGFHRQLLEGALKVEELAHFVQAWFIQHIRGEDSRYAKFAESAGA